MAMPADALAPTDRDERRSPRGAVRAEDLVAAQPHEIDVDAVRAAARNAVRLAIAGHGLAVHFADDGAAAAFRRIYARLESAQTAEFTTWCAPIADGYAFVRSDGSVLLWRGGALRAHVVAFFADAVAVGGLFSSVPDVFSVHASAFAWGDGMALISGISTAGKSTTTVALARRGVAIASDERCCVRAGMVLPFPRAINLRAGGIALLAADAVPGDAGGPQLRALERAGGEARAIRLGDLGLRDDPPPTAPLRAAFLIAGTAAAPQAERLAPHEATAMLVPAIQTGARGLDRLALVHRTFARVHCYRLTLGTPDATAAAIVALGEASR